MKTKEKSHLKTQLKCQMATFVYHVKITASRLGYSPGKSSDIGSETIFCNSASVVTQ